MSDTITTDPAAQQRVLSARTRAAYAGDWALFTDHCTVTDRPALPADPHTVVDFLSGCAAAPATRRRRVAAIDHHHAGAGYPRPGESVVVRAALGRRTGQPAETPAHPERVAAALRGLPSHGWTAGMFGRRDRALLVLSQLAGVPYTRIATLTAGDIEITDGTAAITTLVGTWTVLPGDDALLCGPCAVTRWLRVLDLAVTQPSPRVLARAVKAAPPVTDHSPHQCRSTRSEAEATRSAPLLPPIDQWGYLPFPLQPLSPHSLSRRARDLLNGDLGAHRDLPVDADEDPEVAAPVSRPGATTPGGAYGAAEAAAAVERRRRGLEHLAGITDVLTDVEQRADELNRRAAELVEGWL